LVRANPTFFPQTEAQGHARAEYVFELIKRHMGMAKWPCELKAYERREPNVRVAEHAFVRSPSEPSGYFTLKDGVATITYASDLVTDPRSLISTLAHELAHYLLASIREPSPGGADAHELDTELAVAYVGFGLFAANQAFSFGQHQDPFGQGWSSRRMGYLSERTWAFALALFGVCAGIAIPDEALKPNIAELVRKAAKYLEKRSELTSRFLVVSNRTT